MNLKELNLTKKSEAEEIEQNIQITQPKLQEPKLNILIDSTPEYGYYEQKNLKLTPLLQDLVLKFTQKLNKSKKILMVVNEKKILLQQIYKNLNLHLKKRAQVKTKTTNLLKPGCFTNYMSDYFIEAETVILILTKKHNSKELRLIKELEKVKQKTFLIVLNTEYYHKDFDIVCLKNIKALYYFMYGILSEEEDKEYKHEDFVKLFQFESQRYPFIDDW